MLTPTTLIFVSVTYFLSIGHRTVSSSHAVHLQPGESANSMADEKTVHVRAASPDADPGFLQDVANANRGKTPSRKSSTPPPPPPRPPPPPAPRKEYSNTPLVKVPKSFADSDEDKEHIYGGHKKDSREEEPTTHAATVPTTTPGKPACNADGKDDYGNPVEGCG